MEASGGPTTCPADPAAVVIPSAKDLFSGDVALPTTAKIGSYDIVWWVGIGVGAFSAIIHLPIREKPLSNTIIQTA